MFYFFVVKAINKVNLLEDLREWFETGGDFHSLNL